MRGLEARVIKLEQAQPAGKVVWVRSILADGSLAPLAPGERAAPFIAKLPEVCASTEEWLERYGPQAS